MRTLLLLLLLLPPGDWPAMIDDEDDEDDDKDDTDEMNVWWLGCQEMQRAVREWIHPIETYAPPG